RLFVGIFVGGITRVDVLERLLHLLLEREESLFQLFVRKSLHFRFARIDCGDERLQFFDVALVLCTDKSRDDAIYGLGYVHSGLPLSESIGCPATVRGQWQRNQRNTLFYLFRCARAKKRNTVHFELSDRALGIGGA